jgi:uncharacterized surface protein with fasciclin (FAS1) repeats
VIHPKKLAASAAIALAIGFSAPTFSSAQDDTAAAESTEETAAAEATEETAAAEESAAEETAAAEATEETMAEGEAKDIIDTAVGAGNFTTLAKLLTDAGLVETLKGEGPFTVFAPTDEAFAKVDAATLDALAADPEALAKVLTYHVVAGKVLSSDITPGAVASVAGPELTITVDGETIKVNDATITTADIEASNGVIHVIDTVLLPPTEEATAESTEATEESTEEVAETVAAPEAGEAETGSETALIAAASLGLVALAFGMRTKG